MPRAKIVPALLIAFFMLATWPLWRWLWGEWRGNDYYSHGFLIVPIAAYLAWRRFNYVENGRLQPQSGHNRGLILLTASLIGYLAAFAAKAYFLAAFAMIGLIGGLVWMALGTAMARQLAFPISFLALMTPLPFIEKATLPLALLTGRFSAALTRFLGLDVSVAGTAVTLPNTDLVIGAQCSGVNSIIALFALTALLAYALQGPLWGKLTLLALSLPLAMLGNVLRVAALLFAAHYFSLETAFNFYHDYSGIVSFLLIAILMIPLSKSLQCKTFRYEIL